MVYSFVVGRAYLYLLAPVARALIAPRITSSPSACA